MALHKANLIQIENALLIRTAQAQGQKDVILTWDFEYGSRRFLPYLRVLRHLQLGSFCQS